MDRRVFKRCAIFAYWGQLQEEKRGRWKIKCICGYFKGYFPHSQRGGDEGMGWKDDNRVMRVDLSTKKGELGKNQTEGTPGRGKKDAGRRGVEITL